jgi:hypothetical protein
MKKKFEGYRYLEVEDNVKYYKPSSNIANKKLPKVVDLRLFMTPIEDQSNTNSCTANAVVGACEYLIARSKDVKPFDVSRLFVYYNARWRSGNQDKDDGSHIKYAVESLQKFGACTEDKWGFSKSKVLERPNESAYAQAKNFLIDKTEKVEVDLDTWKKCLAEGHPIIFACALFDSFQESSKKGGIVAMPSPEEAKAEEHGLHAMLCVGYSESDQMFIVRNSWGTKFGDDGYCYMPYNYLMSPKLNTNDCWTIKSADKIPDVEKTWKSKQKTVVNGGKGIKNVDPVTYNYYDVYVYDDLDIDFLEEYTFEEDYDYVDYEPEDYVEYYHEVEELEIEEYEEYEEFIYEESVYYEYEEESEDSEEESEDLEEEDEEYSEEDEEDSEEEDEEYSEEDEEDSEEEDEEDSEEEDDEDSEEDDEEDSEEEEDYEEEPEEDYEEEPEEDYEEEPEEEPEEDEEE